MSAKIHKLEDWVPEDEHILVPEGEYELSYDYHKTWMYMGRYPKASFLFRIFDMGPCNTFPVWAHYNPLKLKGKKGKNGRFSAGWHSRFMLDYTYCFGVPDRKDRFALSKFESNIVLGTVRTVEKNSKQRKYPESLQYSVVGELNGVKQI